MALDRQGIEKRDFPIGRRGYEPEAVDAHLQRIADEFERLQRQVAEGPGDGSPAAATPSAATLAVAASEQVRTIVAAAEQTAADIERAARADAERIRGEAEAAARETRDDAITQSGEHVGRVREATQGMLARLEAMDSELGTLSDQLRTGANRLNADLSLLQGSLGELHDASGVATPAPAPPVAPPAPAPALQKAPAPAAEPQEAIEPAAVEEAPEPVAAAPAAGADEDVEGARLVAMNMLLNGQSREETDRYLAENFDLSDREGLLDEVEAAVGG